MVQKELDHWFRHEYGRVISIFVSKYGAWQIDTIEDSIQNAMYKAMMVWGYKNIPENPSAWIFRVAQNNLFDQLRKKNREYNIPKIEAERSEDSFCEIKDETLHLIFACCHPKLKEQENIILCLKFAAGFGLHEISRTLFISYEAAKKKFQRAKTHFKTFNLSLEIPSNNLLIERLDSVLKVIFLMFTEGYRPTEGEQILKEDLCYEALRIAMTLYNHENLRQSKLFALIALMCFKSARIEARMKSGNDFIRLRDQDRNLWSKELIEEGKHFLSLAFKKDNHSEYHFHAAVESQYVIAESFEKTNWQGLLNIYNYWRKITKNPSLELNRIVVVMHAQGPERALEELNRNCTNQKNHLYYAIKGEVLLKLNRNIEAIRCFESAMEISHNKTEMFFMKRKIREIQNQI